VVPALTTMDDRQMPWVEEAEAFRSAVLEFLG
jgi:hypothetical protein